MVSSQHVGWVERDLTNHMFVGWNLRVSLRFLVFDIVAKPNTSQHADCYFWMLGFTRFVGFQAELMTKIAV